MTIPPWTPAIENGRLYGRGACDVKGGMAAMLHALSRLVREDASPRPTIVFAATVNEEYGFTGARALARSWQGDSRLLPRRPDAVIVAEPTGLDVVVAHKGAVRWRCQTLGRAAHSSQPEQGDNAIFRMARVLAALERYQRDVVPTLASHPRCGHATLSVGLIHGGLSVNTVPDRCCIEIDRRLAPGEDPQAAYRATIDYIAAATAAQTADETSDDRRTGGSGRITHSEPFLSGSGLADRDNIPFGERLLRSVRPSRAAARLAGVPYGTDAAVLSAAGAPCVVFGPGSIAQAHTADEWISLDELRAASDSLVRFATDRVDSTR
jgi:acetylornithine deacetylase